MSDDDEPDGDDNVIVGNFGHRKPGHPNPPEPAPELVAVEGGAPGDPRHVRARLRSRRGADRAVVLLPRADVHGVWVEGRPVDTASDGRLLVFGLPPGGVILDLELSAHGAVEATVIDCASGIPSSSQAVVEARDAADARVLYRVAGHAGNQLHGHRQLRLAGLPV